MIIAVIGGKTELSLVGKSVGLISYIEFLVFGDKPSLDSWMIFTLPALS